MTTDGGGRKRASATTPRTGSAKRRAPAKAADSGEQSQRREIAPAPAETAAQQNAPVPAKVAAQQKAPVPAKVAAQQNAPVPAGEAAPSKADPTERAGKTAKKVSKAASLLDIPRLQRIMPLEDFIESSEEEGQCEPHTLTNVCAAASSQTRLTSPESPRRAKPDGDTPSPTRSDVENVTRSGIAEEARADATLLEGVGVPIAEYPALRKAQREKRRSDDSEGVERRILRPLLEGESEELYEKAFMAWCRASRRNIDSIDVLRQRSWRVQYADARGTPNAQPSVELSGLRAVLKKFQRGERGLAFMAAWERACEKQRPTRQPAPGRPPVRTPPAPRYSVLDS